LRNEEPWLTLHAETGIDYAQQVLAEELRRRRTGKLEWIQVRRDNHLLDCENLAAACADNGWQPSLALLAKHSAARLKVQAKPAQKPDQEPQPKAAPQPDYTQQILAARRRPPGGTWMGVTGSIGGNWMKMS
jgi:hypothetical protein